MIIVTDSRIEFREGTTLFEAGGLGATLRPPVGPGGGSPQKLLNFMPQNMSPKK
jgi:hypothetical protein